MPDAIIGDVSLHYETWGDPSHPTVLLVHGLGAPRLRWPQQLVDALVARGLHVVAHDNRDSGRSTVLHGARAGIGAIRDLLEGRHVDLPYTIADMAADVVGLMDHLGVERAHVVGASMGGMIVQHLAFSHPTRVATMTSVMSTTGARDVGQPTQEAKQVLLTPVPTDDLDGYLSVALANRRTIDSPVHFDEHATRENLLQLWEHGVHPTGTVRQFLALLSDGDRTDRLREVTIPTLVIHGALDPLIDVSGGRATAAAIPGAELLVLDEMAHDVPVPLVGTVAEAIHRHTEKAVEISRS